MNKAYAKLQRIWDTCSATETSGLVDIISVLAEDGKSLRQRDGDIFQITLSIPTSIEQAFVIGLRYRKKDLSFTEDHFLCHSEREGTSNENISYHFKRTLEHQLAEYKGTHKEIPNREFTNTGTGFTDVSTHTLFTNNDS